ncbi:MAG: hypothetical protein ACI4HQ_00080 [Acetatifactor sp.]
MRRNYVKMTVAALACAALVPVMAACGAEQTATQAEQTVSQPEQTVSQPEQTVSQPEQTVSQPEQTVPQPEQTATQPEQTATSETQQWIDSLYNALIQDDAKTVVTLLDNPENVRAHCASYEYAWENYTFARPEGFLLTASDGTKFGVGIFDSNDDYYDTVLAFVSSSDDEYGFRCIYAGDHYVFLEGSGRYVYLKGNEFIESQDGVESVSETFEPGAEVQWWD